MIWLLRLAFGVRQAAQCLFGLSYYLPTGDVSMLQNKVPSGMAAYPFNIAGTARLNDGTGSRGAYEVG